MNQTTEVKLTTPFQAHGRIVDRVSMRLPLVRDHLIVESVGGTGVERTLRLISNLCELASHEVEELSLKDYNELTRVLDGLQQPPALESSTELADTAEVVLKLPIQFEGKVIEKVTVRSPKVKDLLQAERSQLSKTQSEKNVHMTSLCTGLTREEIQVMALSDFYAIDLLLGKFTKSTDPISVAA